MSRNPCAITPVPVETAHVACAAFPKGHRSMTLREALGDLSPPALFTDLYPAVGHDSEPPWRLALVTLMQFSASLTARRAADAMRGRIDWQYALGLDLTDPGLHLSVLSAFRARLLAGAAEERLLTTCSTAFPSVGSSKPAGISAPTRRTWWPPSGR